MLSDRSRAPLRPADNTDSVPGGQNKNQPLTFTFCSASKMSASQKKPVLAQIHEPTQKDLEKQEWFFYTEIFAVFPKNYYCFLTIRTSGFYFPDKKCLISLKLNNVKSFPLKLNLEEN